MLSQRLKQVRSAQGLSLDALAHELGGMVTKQSLSKYEKGLAEPSPRVLNQLAKVLGVKAAYLYSEPAVSISFVAYRKTSRLSRKAQLRMESQISQHLEACVRLQQIIDPAGRADVPIQAFEVESLEDTETAAQALRHRWNMGIDPIASVVGVLEEHHIYALDVDGEEGFDGISAMAHEGEDLIAAATVTRRGIAGERQRLNLVHELGHLMLRIADGVDEEKAAFRFGAAFIAPAELLYREIGQRRTSVSLAEMLLLKRRFGLSLQALVYRLRDLGIINATHAKQWWMAINQRGWKQREPGELPAEDVTWLRQSVMRAVSEDLITLSHAEELLKEPIHTDSSAGLGSRRAFMLLPLSERQRLMAEQAERFADEYEADPEWREWQGGDILDY